MNGKGIPKKNSDEKSSQALFPFGFGLSYTNFTYGAPIVSSNAAATTTTAAANDAATAVNVR